MKKNLLQIVQAILNDMDSDEVNSIDDTIESQQVASIVRQCYEELISNRDWPHLRKIITLNSSLDPNKPTYFRIPETMKELIEFRYDCQKEDDNGRISYRDMKFLYSDAFLRHTSARNSTNPNVQVVTDFSGTKLLIINDQPPTYWTTFDDDHIVLDSYQANIESTLQSIKTQCVAYMEPVWVHTDTAIPDLPSEAFAMLTEEAKSTAFNAIKQMVNQKAEAKAQRQQRWLSRKAWRTHGGVRYENYGRRSAK